MKKLIVGSLALTMMSNIYAKCTNDDISLSAPGKFIVYQTDKEHKFLDLKHPMTFEMQEGHLSQADHLYHISHGKERSKHCELYLNGDYKNYSLKGKDKFQVKKVQWINNHYVMMLDHEKLGHIDCTGVKTFGDLRDAMEPYLTFSCKDRFKASAEAGGRFPASVTVKK